LDGFTRKVIHKIIFGSFQNNWAGFGRAKKPLKTIPALPRIKGLSFVYERATMAVGRDLGH